MAVRQVISCPWQDEQGNVLALGKIVFEASGDALVSGSGELCAGIKGSLSLDSNGQVAASPAQYMWPTDQMAPSGITYTVWVYSAEGELAWGPNYNLTVPSGAGSFNLCTWVPNTTGGSSGGNTGGITLQVEGVNNVVQTLLNLESTDSSITITDEGNGSVNLQASGGGLPASIPFFNYDCTYTESSNVTGVLGSNTINLYAFILDRTVTCSNLNWYSGSGDSAGALSDIGLYSISGPAATSATLVAHIGPTTGITSGSVNTVALVEGTITLQPGLYLFATTNNVGAGFTISFAIPDQLMYAFTTANHSSAGTLPNTLTLTAGGLIYGPVSTPLGFVPAFPAVGLS